VIRQVVLAPEARDDLRKLSFYIAERSGSDRALAYLSRIEASCLGLGDFAGRGTPRDDLWPGLRTTAFGRRIVIAFLISADRVTILRVFYGGRDLEGAFNDDA
jgi:toxin ParE1/3/4